MKINTSDGPIYLDIPWWVGVIFVILVVAIILIIMAVIRSKHTYICDKCGHRFKVKWYKILFPTNINTNTRCLKCPKCGEKIWCPIHHDEL